MAESHDNILQQLPYGIPYRFADAITFVSEERIEGVYTFRKDEFFYPGHFTGNPVTPGLILVECMGQIGLVAFAIFLFPGKKFTPLLSTVEAEFLFPVLPGETVTVISEKIYCRNNILKCRIQMFNETGMEVAHTTALLKMMADE